MRNGGSRSPGRASTNLEKRCWGRLQATHGSSPTSVPSRRRPGLALGHGAGKSGICSICTSLWLLLPSTFRHEPGTPISRGHPGVAIPRYATVMANTSTCHDLCRGPLAADPCRPYPIWRHLTIVLDSRDTGVSPLTNAFLHNSSSHCSHGRHDDTCTLTYSPI